MPWQPFPGFQTSFCERGEYEVLAGGAAGPGKTDCLIALALWQISNGWYKALLLRRTFPQLLEIIDRCHEVYPGFGGVYRSGLDRWTFPEWRHDQTRAYAARGRQAPLPWRRIPVHRLRRVDRIYRDPVPVRVLPDAVGPGLKPAGEYPGDDKPGRYRSQTGCELGSWRFRILAYRTSTR